MDIYIINGPSINGGHLLNPLSVDLVMVDIYEQNSLHLVIFVDTNFYDNYCGDLLKSQMLSRSVAWEGWGWGGIL